MQHKLRRGAAAAIAAAALLSVPSTVSASPQAIRAKRAEARRAEAAVQRIGMQVEPAIQRYDHAVVELGAVRRRIADNQTGMAIATANVAAARKRLGELLADAYRNGDADVVASLLAARSLGDLIDQVQLVERGDAQLANLVQTLREGQRDLARRRRQLEADRRRAQGLVDVAAAEKQRIVAALAEQKRLVRGLRAEIAQLQADERARQARLAAEARARLRAEQAHAAQADPGIGGSAGAGTPAGSGSGSGAGSIPPPVDGSIGARAVAAAMRWLGTPYSWGGGNAQGPTNGIAQGAGTVGFDCSGLTLYAYAQVGISLAHYTGDQWNAGTRISSRSDLAPGDLVFFGADLGHMGIYIGGGQFIHAPHTGDVVKISDLSSGYYADAFVGGVRPY